MEYIKRPKTIFLKGNDTFEGNSIEKDMEIAVTTKRMPEQNLSSVFYTQKKYGVLPECDIRTDRFEVAQKAQNAIAIDFKHKEKQKLAEPQTTDVNTSSKEAEP